MPNHSDGNEIVYAPDRGTWRTWLKTNHKKKTAAWLLFYKAASGKKYVSYPDAVEEALCFGWIDSKKMKLDDERSIQFFSPRSPRSNWSKLNKDRVAKLIAQRKMTSAGMATITLAKEKGTWDALNEVEQTIVPEDLAAAFEPHKKALTNFNAFPRSSRMIILGWIHSAKTPGTRNKRIEETVTLAADNIRAHHYSPAKTK